MQQKSQEEYKDKLEEILNFGNLLREAMRIKTCRDNIMANLEYEYRNIPYAPIYCSQFGREYIELKGKRREWNNVYAYYRDKYKPYFLKREYIPEWPEYILGGKKLKQRRDLEEYIEKYISEKLSSLERYIREALSNKSK